MEMLKNFYKTSFNMKDFGTENVYATEAKPIQNDLKQQQND